MLPQRLLSAFEQRLHVCKVVLQLKSCNNIEAMWHSDNIHGSFEQRIFEVAAMSLQHHQREGICSMVKQHCCNIILWFIPQLIFGQIHLT